MENWRLLGLAWLIWLPVLATTLGNSTVRKDARVPGLRWLHFDSPRELGFDDRTFFIQVLQACPDGAKIDFAWSEPESFVEQFRPWSHRQNVSAYEADYYVIDRELVALAARLSHEGRLETDHHFCISGPNDEPLIQSFDDFTVIAMTEPFHARLRQGSRVLV